MLVNKTDPFGFILVTNDPEKAAGGRGSAQELLLARLEKGSWPLYARTRCRGQIDIGSRLAFYVGGGGNLAGHIVATARAANKRTTGRRDELIDPVEFVTSHPDIVLELEQVEMLSQPVFFRDLLPSLSFCPSNMSKWGIVLMGGARAVSEEDWRILIA